MSTCTWRGIWAHSVATAEIPSPSLVRHWIQDAKRSILLTSFSHPVEINTDRSISSSYITYEDSICLVCPIPKCVIVFYKPRINMLPFIRENDLTTFRIASKPSDRVGEVQIKRVDQTKKSDLSTVPIPYLCYLLAALTCFLNKATESNHLHSNLAHLPCTYTEAYCKSAAIQGSLPMIPRSQNKFHCYFLQSKMWEIVGFSSAKRHVRKTKQYLQVRTYRQQ